VRSWEAKELKAAGYTCAEAKAAGCTFAEVRQAGYSNDEVEAGGFPLKELKAGGYTCAEAVAAGWISRASLKAAGYTWKEELRVSSGDASKVRLLDGSLSSYWQSDGSPGKHWIEFTTTAGAPIGEVRMYAKDHDNFSPKRLVIKRRLRGGEWKECKTILNLSKSPDRWETLLTEEEAGEADGIRIEIRENHDSGIDCKITALQLS
jgi:hypothetical protein